MIVAATIPIFDHGEHEWRRHEVLTAPPAMLQHLGRHFIVGYRDFSEIERLVSRGAVGGVFITQRNIAGKSAEQVRAEIRYLQDLQAKNGLPQLYIAADQEGGLVSRLSPLVRDLPALGQWRVRHSASEFAEIQARGLADLGVNLNFSPVVDLRTAEQAKIQYGWTRLDERAISDDPQVVADTAAAYCAEFDRQNLRCTLKHFPGLGHVTTDTHWFEGQLDDSPQDLERNDWLPFRHATAQTHAFLMIGHVRLRAIDAHLPASISKAVVTGLIRETWGHDGIIVTDDFTMGPIAGRSGGIRKSSELALNAGVDLILISYDGELYFDAMAHLLNRYQDGDLNLDQLARSDARLDRDREYSSETPASDIAGQI